MLKLGLPSSTSQWEVACFAGDQDLVFSDKIEPTERNPTEVIWSSRSGETHLHYIDDPFIDLRYLAIAGPDEAHLANLAVGAVGALTLDATIDRLCSEEGHESRLQSVSLLAVLAPPQPDPGILDLFAELLGSPDPAIRRRTVMAAAYPGWPQFEDLLAPLASGDPEPAVRDRAEVAVEALRKRRG